MSNELDFLFEEAKEQISQGNYQKATDILKVLVDSGYEQAKPLYEKYKNTVNNGRNSYPNNNQSTHGTNNQHFKSNQNRTNSYRKVEKDLPLLIDPSNKIWLKIILYSLLTIEAIFLLVLFAQLFSLRRDMFIFGLIGLAIFHLIAMLSLNISFNIQTIKEDLKDIKKRL